MNLLDLIKQFGQANYNYGFHWGKPIVKQFDEERTKLFSEIVSRVDAEVKVQIADVSKLLEDCGHKLNLYSLNVSGEYIGGVEHSQLIKRIAEMLELLTKSNLSA